MGMFKYTYGYWDLLKNDIRNSPHFLHNWVVHTRSLLDIQRRCDFLISLFKRELYNEVSEEIQPKKSGVQKDSDGNSVNIPNDSDQGVIKQKGKRGRKPNPQPSVPKKRGRKPKVKPTENADIDTTPNDQPKEPSSDDDNHPEGQANGDLLKRQKVSDSQLETQG